MAGIATRIGLSTLLSFQVIVCDSYRVVKSHCSLPGPSYFILVAAITPSILRLRFLFLGEIGPTISSPKSDWQEPHMFRDSIDCPAFSECGIEDDRTLKG